MASESYEFIGLTENMNSALSSCHRYVISSWDVFFSKIIVKRCDCYMTKELGMQTRFQGASELLRHGALSWKAFVWSGWGKLSCERGVRFFLNVFFSVSFGELTKIKMILKID